MLKRHQSDKSILDCFQSVHCGGDVEFTDGEVEHGEITLLSVV